MTKEEIIATVWSHMMDSYITLSDYEDADEESYYRLQGKYEGLKELHKQIKGEE